MEELTDSFSSEAAATGLADVGTEAAVGTADLALESTGLVFAPEIMVPLILMSFLATQAVTDPSSPWYSKNAKKPPVRHPRKPGKPDYWDYIRRSFRKYSKHPQLRPVLQHLIRRFLKRHDKSKTKSKPLPSQTVEEVDTTFLNSYNQDPSRYLSIAIQDPRDVNLGILSPNQYELHQRYINRTDLDSDNPYYFGFFNRVFEYDPPILGGIAPRGLNVFGVRLQGYATFYDDGYYYGGEVHLAVIHSDGISLSSSNYLDYFNPDLSIKPDYESVLEYYLLRRIYFDSTAPPYSTGPATGRQVPFDYSFWFPRYYRYRNSSNPSEYPIQSALPVDDRRLYFLFFARPTSARTPGVDCDVLRATLSLYIVQNPPQLPSLSGNPRVVPYYEN